MQQENISKALNMVYSYLVSDCQQKEIELLKEKLKSISSREEFEFQIIKEKHSYDDIQKILSTMNENETCKKTKGVYYTPLDVVRFILNNSINLQYDKISEKQLDTEIDKEILHKSLCFNESRHFDEEICIDDLAFLNKTIYDPTCGCGEFLLSMLETKILFLRKYTLLQKRTKNITNNVIEKILFTIYGNDINQESTILSKIRIFFYLANIFGIEKCKKIDTILNNNFTNIDFISKMPYCKQKFDFIIGNPPYVEDNVSKLDLEEKYGNIYANVLAHSTKLLKPNGVMSFIIPLSYVATPRMQKIREELIVNNIKKQYILSYADRPNCLFQAAHQRLCIMMGKNTKESETKIYTSTYQYWYKEEREDIFKNVPVIRNPYIDRNYMPKIATQMDIDIYKKVDKGYSQENTKNLGNMIGDGNQMVYLNMRAAFWIKAFRKEHKEAGCKIFTFQSDCLADYFMIISNSSLFWWYWICNSDCWHITNKELDNFIVPILKKEDEHIVKELAEKLEEKLESTKLYVGTKQTDYEYKHKSCIQEIHRIDDYINKAYGLTKEESEYIKDFAYPYRIGENKYEKT